MGKERICKDHCILSFTLETRSDDHCAAWVIMFDMPELVDIEKARYSDDEPNRLFVVCRTEHFTSTIHCERHVVFSKIAE